MQVNESEANSSHNSGHPRSRRKLAVLILLIALLYSPKYLIRAYNHVRPDPYLDIFRLNNVEVPKGPYVTIQKAPLPASFNSIDLGKSWPISSDQHGNLILFIDKDAPPADFLDIRRTGQYLRKIGGHYQDIGDDPAQLTVDGKLIQVRPETFPSSWTMKVDGEEIKPCPVNNAVTYEGSYAMFAASNQKFLNIRYEVGWPRVEGFFESGKEMGVRREIDRPESFLITFLRKVGVFENDQEFSDNHSMQSTSDGTVFTQSWANHGLYQNWYNRGGRLCVLSGDRFIFVPELKDTHINTETVVTPNGKVGINLIGNCSYLTRPAIYERGKLTLLPIPEGSISADLIGLADDGSAVLRARHDSAMLFYENSKLYRMADLLSKNPLGILEPVAAYLGTLKSVPDKLRGLRIKNPMLPDGSILCQVAGEDSRLVLLQKYHVVK